MRGSIYINRIYKREGSDKYYFQYTDKTGKRKQKCTGFSDKDKAGIAANDFVHRLQNGIDLTTTFLGEIKKYQNINTNPRYLDAKVSGESYGLEYAKKIAISACTVEKVLSQSKHAYLLDWPLYMFLRSDVKDIATVLVQEKGRCRSTQLLFCFVKALFSQAVENGLIQTSPAAMIKDIKYDQKKRSAIPNQSIAWLMAREDLFPSHDAWAFFSILATTGMRRGELLALSSNQIYNGVLTVNRALKSDNVDDVGLPKWNFTRTIPLSDLTMKILQSVKPNKRNGRYFYIHRQRVQYDFMKIKVAAMAADPENRDLWENLSPHVLRHSLNTNLLISGLSPVLVAEYLSWHHQELLDMQKRYTHLVVQNLKPIATAIDRLYSYHDTANIVQFQA